MEYNWRSLCIALILLTFSFVSVLASQSEQNKQDAHKLCGPDFIDVYKLICKLKESKRGRGNRTKRSILGFIKASNLDILEPKKANQFLNKLSRPRRNAAATKDNANEECCHEGCSYQEIAEYVC